MTLKVLKFGGTSVANAANIELVLEIIFNQSKHTKLAIVVSALSGVTDLLLEASAAAALKNQHYKLLLSEIKKKHFEVISALIKIENTQDRKSTRLNSSHSTLSRMPSSA